MEAGHYRLDNLAVFIDYNKVQAKGCEVEHDEIYDGYRFQLGKAVTVFDSGADVGAAGSPKRFLRAALENQDFCLLMSSSFHLIPRPGSSLM
jgi:hypothetical protein